MKMVTGKRFKILLALTALILASVSWGKVRVEEVLYENKNPFEAQVTILYTGELQRMPELSFSPSLVQVVISDAYIWPKMEKKIQVRGEEFDGTMLAYQFSKDLVRVRAMLPFSVEREKNRVKISVDKGKINLTFPRQLSFQGEGTPRNLNEYDESYLNTLLKEKVQKIPHEEKHQDSMDRLTRELSAGNEGKDEVSELSSSVAVASVGKKQSASAVPTVLEVPSTAPPSSPALFMNQYILKFLGFMAIVLLIFFATVHLFKKGVLSKGKLGFLNQQQIINVMGNTYIGPKRSLLLVKVQNQVFLLGNSENGISFISEIKDATGVLKKGEMELAGSNFDSSVSSAYERPDLAARVKEKEEELEEARERERERDRRPWEGNVPRAGERVKFSDQIKGRLKQMRPLI